MVRGSIPFRSPNRFKTYRAHHSKGHHLHDGLSTFQTTNPPDIWRALKFSNLSFSGCRELNPVYMHPMHAYYRYTTPRKMTNTNGSSKLLVGKSVPRKSIVPRLPSAGLARGSVNPIQDSLPKEKGRWLLSTRYRSIKEIKLTDDNYLTLRY